LRVSQRAVEGITRAQRGGEAVDVGAAAERLQGAAGARRKPAALLPSTDIRDTSLTSNTMKNILATTCA